MKKKFISVSNTSLALFLSLFILIQTPAFSVEYPEYTGDNVVDLSGKFDNRYVDSLKSELNNSTNEVRVVFLDTKDKINLGFYAPKLFEKWNMHEDSILVVIDPYLNKTGYAIGKTVREEMRKRLAVKADDKNLKKDNGKNIDYDNLASAIFDKFSPAQIKQEGKNNKKNSDSSGSGGNNYNSESSGSKKKKVEKDLIVISPLTKKIILSVISLMFLSGGIFFFYNKKKRLKEQTELKTNYLFDADIQKQDIATMIEKIEADILKMNSYKGKTQQEAQTNIEKLHSWKNKAELFIEKMDNQLEEVDIDDLGSIRELLDEGSIIKEELDKTHKESVSIRKDYKSTIKKAEVYASDIRVNLENCKFTIESIRTIYKLPLNQSEIKISECEQEIEKINELASQNNPIELKQLNQNVHDKIKQIKKELDIIPHLYKQLQETIPVSIDSSLEESLMDIHHRNRKKKEINDLRNDALISLSDGDLKRSEELIANIFEKINQIRATVNKS